MTDEAPALATVSLLPIIQAYSKSSDITLTVDERACLSLSFKEVSLLLI